MAVAFGVLATFVGQVTIIDLLLTGVQVLLCIVARREIRRYQADKLLSQTED
jgi:hypothetical protein